MCLLDAGAGMASDMSQTHDEIYKLLLNTEMKVAEAMALGQILHAPVRAVNPDEDIFRIVNVLKGALSMKEGKIIQAIKNVRQELGCSVKAAKALVDLFDKRKEK